MNPVASTRSRQEPRRPLLRVLDHAQRPASHAQRSASIEQHTVGAGPHRPELPLVSEHSREPARRIAPVLLAGADEHSRAMLRAELGATLAPRTRWVEASDVAGALERAAHSRMVVLAGGVDDADAESLMRMLGRRHPELPVIRVDAPQQAVAGVCG